MEVKALARQRRVQPRKVRLVSEKVKGKPATYAAHLLRYHKSKGAQELRKVIVSAIANAEENFGLSSDNLQIRSISVDEGPRLKRIRAAAMGRANRIIKKTSHITVIIDQMEEANKQMQPKAKLKQRPSFIKLLAASKKKAAKSEVKPEIKELALNADTQSSDLNAESANSIQSTKSADFSNEKTTDEMNNKQNES